MSTISPLPANLAELDCLKSCSQGPGGALWGSSSRLQLPQSPPEGLQCAGSPAARWSWRPSMTTATEGMTGGRSASERASGLFSWKRPMLTGGRWEQSLCFVSRAFYTLDYPFSITPHLLILKEIHLKSENCWQVRRIGAASKAKPLYVPATYVTEVPIAPIPSPKRLAMSASLNSNLRILPRVSLSPSPTTTCNQQHQGEVFLLHKYV